MQIAYPRCIHTRASTRNSSIYVFKSPRSSSGTFVGFSNRTVYSCISICTYTARHRICDTPRSLRECVYTHASISIIVVSLPYSPCELRIFVKLASLFLNLKKLLEFCACSEEFESCQSILERIMSFKAYENTI